MKRHYESHQREECETCKSYLTQFHRCDTKVAYYICYLYSSRRVSHLYYRSGIRVNWTIYIYLYTYIWIRKRRGVSLEKFASFWNQHHCTETKRWTCWNDRTTHSDPFWPRGWDLQFEFQLLRTGGWQRQRVGRIGWSKVRRATAKCKRVGDEVGRAKQNVLSAISVFRPPLPNP